MANVFERSLDLHEKLKGKITVELKTGIESADDLSLVYSPGVAEPCREIAKDPSKQYKYTWKENTIAVVTNGTAVLGLGNIGAKAALPVMEGKCALFKRFGGVNAVPICVEETDPDQFIAIAKAITPAFGGINLEDIKAPDCIKIEQTLKKECDIPIFHDDQHGTSIVCQAGLINALKLVGKKPEECQVVMSGVGAAGSSIIHMLKGMGIGNIYGFRSTGILNRKNPASYGNNALYKELASMTNDAAEDLTMEEAMKRADIFIGVSVPNTITASMVQSMKRDPIIFALANPDPEIDYEVAKAAGARVVATGRSDYPNQVNNVLAFPGIFRGALDVHATQISDEMKTAAGEALAALVSDEELDEDHVIPSPFDERAAEAVAKAVGEMAKKQGYVHPQ